MRRKGTLARTRRLSAKEDVVFIASSYQTGGVDTESRAVMPRPILAAKVGVAVACRVTDGKGRGVSEDIFGKAAGLQRLGRAEGPPARGGQAPHQRRC